MNTKPIKKATPQIFVDLFEDKEKRKYEVNFLGSPIKETWPKDDTTELSAEPSTTETLNTSDSTTTTKSRRKKGALFLTDVGSVHSAQKFITQRTQRSVLADGMHVSDETSSRMSKYFGDESKLKFYNTYRELKSQKELLPLKRDKNGGVSTELSDFVNKSNEDHPVNKSIDDLVGLGVIRPSTVSGKAQKMKSNVSETFNVHKFAESSIRTADMKDLASVSSSISSALKELAPGGRNESFDDESIFSDSDENDDNEKKTPLKPLFPFVSIFSNEKISERRQSMSQNSVDIKESSLDCSDAGNNSTAGSMNTSSIDKLKEEGIASRGQNSKTKRRLSASAGSRTRKSVTEHSSDMKGQLRNKISDRSLSKSSSKKVNSSRRQSLTSGSTNAPKSNPSASKKNYSCVGRISTPEKSSSTITNKRDEIGAVTCKSIDEEAPISVNEPLDMFPPKEEFGSFGSEHSFPALDVHEASAHSENLLQHSSFFSTVEDEVSSEDESVLLGADNEGYMTYACDSPRAKFLSGCIDKKIPPRNALILRAKVSSVLFLEHHGMGDDLAVLLAPALATMPFVSGINIADNNLTDIGLEPVISSIASCPKVRDLNISENIIGPRAASALATLLGNPLCKLTTVTMRKCDIDDGECERFVEALKENKYLQHLDLSDNLLGKDENLNAVKPDIVTAGEALASLLREGTCPLKTLKIAWNMIRMEGAYELCTALEACRTLGKL